MIQLCKKQYIILCFQRIFSFIIENIVLITICAFITKNLHEYISNTLIFNLFGILFCLFYFAIFNSQLNKGKTIGKLLCRIRVASLQAQSIKLTTSFLRACIIIMLTSLIKNFFL